MPLAYLPLFKNSNYAEAALWIAIALACAVFAFSPRPIHRRFRPQILIASVTFVLFGISDIVEAQDFSSAWYRPWWLFRWKAACVAIFAWLFVGYLRFRLSR